MQLGSSYPVIDLGVDAGVLTAFAQGLEDIGYDQVLLSEHILSFDLAAHPGWTPYNPVTEQASAPLYDHTAQFFEPLVTFGFLAGVTTRLRMATSVMVLGMRQAALVAKQAAIADVFSGGRVTLGIGSGWNDLAYQAMGVDFRTRGARVEEQIEVMRALWTNDVVSFEGQWHTIAAAGINPLPVQRPIPIWIGGTSDKALERAARIGDGWYPGQLLEPAERGEPYRLSSRGAALLAKFRAALHANGRRSADVPLVGIVNIGPHDPGEVANEIAGWAELGVTQVNVRSSRYPQTWSSDDGEKDTDGAEVDRHLEALQSVRSAWQQRSTVSPATGER